MPSPRRPRPCSARVACTCEPLRQATTRLAHLCIDRAPLKASIIGDRTVSHVRLRPHRCMSFASWLERAIAERDDDAAALFQGLMVTLLPEDIARTRSRTRDRSRGSSISEASETVAHALLQLLGPHGGVPGLLCALSLCPGLEALAIRQQAQPRAMQQIPADLARLTQLTALQLTSFVRPSTPGWEHLPRQLEQLKLVRCGFRSVPACLSGLTRLTLLSFHEADDRDWRSNGWQHLPRQLRTLRLAFCRIGDIPAAFEDLTALHTLAVSGQAIDGGWQHLPRQLQRLDLRQCLLDKVPAQLRHLTQLRELCLANQGVERGWSKLPQSLQRLDLRQCHLNKVPAKLQRLPRLDDLDLSQNPLANEELQQVPRTVRTLRLNDMYYGGVPSQLSALTQLVTLDLRNNPLRDGWGYLPASLHRVFLSPSAAERARPFLPHGLIL